MSTVIDPNKDADSTGGVNVLGGGGGQAAPVADTGAAAPSAEGGSSMIQSQGGSVNNATSQGSTANKGASKASSGMFTNIQNYVKKNQPQAQKMAGAATQDFSKQAGEIRQAAESKKAQQDAALGANTKAIEGAQTFAQGQVDQIMGKPPIQYGGPSREDVPLENIQRPMSSDSITSYTNPLGDGVAPKTGQTYNPDTNSYGFESKQTMTDGMKELSQEGRDQRSIINPYEGKVAGDTAYRMVNSGTNGQMGVDTSEEYTITQDMIDNWGGSAAAKPTQEDNNQRFQDLMGGTIAGVNQVGNLDLAKQQSRASALQNLAKGTDTEQGRRNLLKETFQDRGGYSRGQSGLDNLIVSGDQGARESMIQDTQGQSKEIQDQLRGIQSDSSTALAAQQGQLGNFGETISGMGTSAVSGIDQGMQDQLAAEIAARQGISTEDAVASVNRWKESAAGRMGDTSSLQNFAQQIIGTGQDLAWRGRDEMNALAGGGQGGWISREDYVNGTGEYSDDLNRMERGKFEQAVDKLSSGYDYGEDLGFDSGSLYDDIYGSSNTTGGSSMDQVYNKQGIRDSFKKYQDKISGFDSEAAIKTQMEKLTQGQSLEDYNLGTGLDKYDTASEENVSRHNALQKLMGKEDVIDSGRRQTEFTKAKALEDLLAKYNK